VHTPGGHSGGGVSRYAPHCSAQADHIRVADTLSEHPKNPFARRCSAPNRLLENRSLLADGQLATRRCKRPTRVPG
jgi:hypothetical protein